MQSCPRCHQSLNPTDQVCHWCRFVLREISSEEVSASAEQVLSAPHRPALGCCLSHSEWQHAKMLFVRCGYKIAFRTLNKYGDVFGPLELVIANPSDTGKCASLCCGTGRSLLDAATQLFWDRLVVDAELRKEFQSNPFTDLTGSCPTERQTPASRSFAIFLRHPWTGTPGL